MDVVIIGGSHAGVAAALAIKKIGGADSVTIIEKSNYFSFISSSLNLALKNEVSIDALESQITTEEIKAKNVSIIYAKVEQINFKKKKIYYKKTEGEINGEIFYDYLILAMGSSNYGMRDSAIERIKNKIIVYKNREETKEAYKILDSSLDIGIIGAGLIGLELADSLARNPDKKVVVIEKMDRPLFRYFDKDITDILLANLPVNVTLHLNQSFYESNEVENKIVIKQLDGEKILIDACVLAINPLPCSDLVNQDLVINNDKTIDVNSYLQTSNPFVYAIGDLIKVPFGQNQESIYIPLTTNARKTGYVAAFNILNRDKVSLPPTQRNIGTHIFGLYLGSSGITWTESGYYGIKSKSVSKDYFSSSRKFNSVKGFIRIKLIYREKDLRIIGGQVISNDLEGLNLSNLISVFISKKSSLNDLIFADQFFNPEISTYGDIFSDLGQLR